MGRTSRRGNNQDKKLSDEDLVTMREFSLGRIPATAVKWGAMALDGNVIGKLAKLRGM